MGTPHFADRLVTRVRRLGHPLCVGIDPMLERIPPLFRAGDMRRGSPETGRAVAAFCRAIVERVAGRVALVKPQIAFFEALGLPGMAALGATIEAARDAGLIVLLDAKRGDIGSTAVGYADAYLAPDAPTAVDAITLNPWLGLDTLEPWLRYCASEGRGAFVLVKTSNPGSADLQDLAVEGAPVYADLASRLCTRVDALRGPDTGWSSLGVVVGATYPEEADRVRDRLPHALFLVPGYGAQGASADAAVRSFTRGPGGVCEGGIVNSSRAVLFPDGGDTDAASAWERAIDAALDRATSELGEAVAA